MAGKGPMPGILEVDLHGKNVYQARIALRTALQRADASVYRLRIIHGYQGGQALKEMTEGFASHPKVKRLLAVNPGCTDLILREL